MNKYQLFVFLIIDLTPYMLLAITGIPKLIASNCTIPNASRELTLGRINISTKARFVKVEILYPSPPIYDSFNLY